MSTDQPTPGSGEPSDDERFRKEPPPPPPPSPPGGGGPYGGGWPPHGEAYGAADPLAGMPPLANRGRRLVARIIDGLLIGLPVGAITALIVGGYNPVQPDQSGRAATVQGVVMLVYVVYEGLMLTHYGQTVGKMIMKVRVAMLDTGAIPAGQPGWVRACVYTLPQIVPCCGFLFWLVNVLFCTWDKPYRQCLHDKAAKTVVVAVP